MALRNYSSAAVGTTITAGISNVATTVTVAATTGFPAAPFIAILEPDTTNEEVVLVTNVASLTLTITRGYDGTTAVGHVIGSKLQHSFSAIDFREPNTFLNSGGTVGGAVTVSGAVLTTGVTGANQTSTGALDYFSSNNAVRILAWGPAATNPNVEFWAGQGGGAATRYAFVNSVGINTVAADTATAASHYYVETASDGYIRPKTLANTQSEIVTTAAVNAAAATTTGTVTSGTWSASFGAVSGANLTSLTAGNLSGTIPSAVLANSTVFIGTTGIALNRASAALTLAGITLTTPTIADYTNAQHTHTTAAGGGVIDYSATYAPLNATVAQKTANYTLAAGDAGDLIEFNLGTALTCFIPTDATWNAPIGTSILLLRLGAGSVTVTATTPGTTTVVGTPSAVAGSPVLRAQYSVATVVKRAANYWVVMGDIA